MEIIYHVFKKFAIIKDLDKIYITRYIDI